MRLRYKAFAIPELQEHKQVYFDPKDLAGKWNEVFGNDNPIHLEIGAGRGSFVATLARQNPDINYVAIEMDANILVYASRLITEEKLQNVRLIRGLAEYLGDHFGENEISKIYINFPNPWPKRKQNRRRLTHPNQLNIYKRILKNKSEVEFKTDDRPFFEDSLKYFENEGFDLIESSFDLELRENNIVTEYESKWRGLGVPINYLKARLNKEDNMKLICYKKCSTCKGIEKLLGEKNIKYDYRNIDSENPTSEEIKKWHEESGLDIKKFFNTSGVIYRENNYKDKLEDMSIEEKYELLATSGMLVKRPILLDGEKVFVGPEVKKYLESK